MKSASEGLKSLPKVQQSLPCSGETKHGMKQ